MQAFTFLARFPLCLVSTFGQRLPPPTGSIKDLKNLAQKHQQCGEEGVGPQQEGRWYGKMAPGVAVEFPNILLPALGNLVLLGVFLARWLLKLLPPERGQGYGSDSKHWQWARLGGCGTYCV